MSTSPDKDTPVDYTSTRNLQAILGKHSFKDEMAKYKAKLDAAYRFAEGDDGLFLLGLTLNGLDLVPPGTMMDMKVYWIRAHASKSDLWETGSYIVEV